jgi:hypothetical protein
MPDLYDGPEYDADEPDWDAMPVIVCAECGETVHADNLQDLYCLACDAVIDWESRREDEARCRAIEAETLTRNFDEVPF